MFRVLTTIFIVLLLYPFLVSPVLAQEFQREVDTIPVIINEVLFQSSFAGGFNSAKPTFADIDNDGDLDLFMGEIVGNINFYRNTGSVEEPSFTLETRDFASINVGRLSTPTFTDIDNDGDFDLFVGENDGNLNFYRNTGTATNPTFTLETENFGNIDVGGFSAPIFADIDNDGDLDLFMGEGAGNINFYRNTGSVEEPSFTLETENLDSIDVGAFSTPTFADIDNDGDLDLFVGESTGSVGQSTGNINFYRNTGTSTNPTFTLVTENLTAIIAGVTTAPTFADIDNDGDLDLFVGDFDGDLNFYRNTGTIANPIFTQEAQYLDSIDVGAFSLPTFGDIDGDGDLDLFVGETDGNINFYRNTGTATEPTFSLVTESFASIDVGLDGTPTFADIDNDGDLDLFVGENPGNINFYRNTGTSTNPTFTLVTENLTTFIAGGKSAPTFADIDGDGDLDLFMGEIDGKINFYRNTGTATEPTFTFETVIFASIDVGQFSTPTFPDIDDDGDLDLFVGEAFGRINFYRNMGTATEPTFTLVTESFAAINVDRTVGPSTQGGFSAPIFADIDNDGDLDLFVGEIYGGLHFYRNVTSPTGVTSPETHVTPEIFEVSQNYPNPFNPETTIQYQIPKTSHVKLAIYNLVGQPVTTLVDKKQQEGFYSVQWDGKDDLGINVASGVYLYRLETGKFVKVRKLTLVR